ncbi:hypothetical protein DAPPUDRAFT_333222 [Daphnia pulex]|uniref:Uncharacterized protein n=1 Tax=Daphnia pulex TaxID=6669 RepID=E9HS88_DAPPU|nr:hypothetical protein DAPPUDRAFT_333222 [Daphnia pulex]|eukprot:EFX65399.1 hypothetical protein DAPPUDRAFT_333222 [Daphnia pulex]
MSENRVILEKTFALTSQLREGTIALLNLTVELRKIPATVERETTKPNGPIIIVTTRRYAQGQILVEGDVTEVEEAENVAEDSAENKEAAKVPIAIACQEIADEEDEVAIEDT